MALEFIERLSQDFEEERWLVRGDAGAEPHVAWIFRNEDRDWLVETERQTQPWLGPIHPRVSTIFTSSWRGEHLMFEIDDDRGPHFAKAAAQLADPVERERWCVAQIIAIADGLATMGQRDDRFVHRQIEPPKLFVDIAGHARLRAPIALVIHGPRPGRLGAGTIRGNFGFLTPEQVKGMVPEPATDVFALATNLYLALTGTRPFERASELDTLKAILYEEPAPFATHSPGLAQVLERALRKELEERIPTPGTFAGELWQCVPDAVDYDEVISDKIVAWRATAEVAPAHMPMFGEPCRMRWDQLAPTADTNVRRCKKCKQEVVRVERLAQIVPLVGRCIAYTGGG